VDDPALALETVMFEPVVVGETEPVAATWWARTAKESAKKVFMVTELRFDRELRGWARID